MARNKLDYHSQREWEEEARQHGADHVPTMEEFLKFVNERCRTLEILELQRKIRCHNKGKYKKKRQARNAATAQVCMVCKESHSIFNCPEFLKLPIQERIAEAKRQQLCINCLRAGHYAKNCKSSKCRKFQGSKVHNTLLHIEQTESSNKESHHAAPKNSEDKEEKENSVSMHSSRKSEYVQERNELIKGENSINQGTTFQVILSTAQIYVRDIQGRKQTYRALLDPESQSHFITKELTEKLQLSCRKESFTINGISQNTTEVKILLEYALSLNIQVSRLS